MPKQTGILNIAQINGYNEVDYQLGNNKYIGQTARMSTHHRARDEEVVDTSIEISPDRGAKTNDVIDSIEKYNIDGALDNLRESYMKRYKKSTSYWLNYADNTCFIYFYRGGGEPNERLASFDLDGTIIKPKSNKRIPRSATDWQFFSVWTKVKIQQVIRENQARFVMFTNQNGIGRNIVPLEEVQERVELVTQRLEIPCTVLVATDKNEFRKPLTGMFQLFEKSFNDSKQIDPETSFYCGDAIGYPSHSDADIMFAQRLGLPFLTPEKFLRGVKPKLVQSEKQDKK